MFIATIEGSGILMRAGHRPLPGEGVRPPNPSAAVCPVTVYATYASLPVLAEAHEGTYGLPMDVFGRPQAPGRPAARPARARGSTAALPEVTAELPPK
ncbi:hypothetical protein [Streptomyces sp. NPDC054797]